MGSDISSLVSTSGNGESRSPCANVSNLAIIPSNGSSILFAIACAALEATTTTAAIIPIAATIAIIRNISSFNFSASPLATLVSISSLSALSSASYLGAVSFSIID